MYKKLKSGFSLAEALITLLIVCLITLASIPILTKKRRNLDEGQRGMWICSRNSAGQYVYWDKNNPVGQKDNPDSWVTTNKCVFTPPAGADRFSLTVIGGGGGGGSASSTHLDKGTAMYGNTGSFSPTEDGYYYVEVVGGGGGRGATVGSSEINGAASGAGGSGAGVFGYLYLLKGTTYSMKGGAAGSRGESHYHSGCNRGSNSRTPGSNGGDSYFKADNGGNDKVTKIEVAGGRGGDSTSYNADNHAVGGSGGGAGWIISSNRLSNSKNIVEISGSKGASGAARNWNNPGRIPQGGISPAEYSSANATGSTKYGRGSDGEVNYNGITTGKDAVTGVARVSLIERYFGQGGSASVPSSYYLPKIEGHVEVEISPAANADTDGGNTVAQIKRNGITGRTFIGYGAKAGGKSKTITEPEQGQHSQFTMTGGGIPSPACTDPKYIPSGYGPVTIKGNKCTKVVCNANIEQTSDVGAILTKLRRIYNNNISTAGVRTIPTGFEKVTYQGEELYAPYGLMNMMDDSYNGTKLSVDISAYTGSSDRSSIENYCKNTLKLYDYVRQIVGFPTMNPDGYFASFFPKYNPGDLYTTDQSLGEFANYTNKDEIYNNYRCLAAPDVTYLKRCVEEKEVEETISNGYHQATYQQAYCAPDQNGGNGTSFGAGGGGGYASLTPNVASRGGKGGAGAVVIEW